MFKASGRNKQQTYITNATSRGNDSVEVIVAAVEVKLAIWRLQDDTQQPKVIPEIAHWLVSCLCELPEAHFPDMRKVLAELDEGTADERLAGVAGEAKGKLKGDHLELA